MNKETRFWLASQISEERFTEDARTVLAEAKNMTKIKPLAIITDGLRAYERAITKEFHTMMLPRTEHIRVPNIRNRSMYISTIFQLNNKYYIVRSNCFN